MDLIKSSKFKKIMGIVLTVSCIACMFICGASADSVITNFSADEAVSAASGLFQGVYDVLNFTNIAKVLGIGIGACVGIWLAWWGIRKLIRMLSRVLERGRLSL